MSTTAKPIASFVQGVVLYLLLCVATCLMLRMVLDYTALRDDVDFLRFKQVYVSYWWWKTAFYVHVFSSVAALGAGFTQFSGRFLREHRSWHRIIGRVYAYDILLINFPTGMVLAVCANGLLPGRIAFVVLDCLWFTFTLIAVMAARNGQIARHREFMIRSYALTFSAITLRTWKVILSHTFEIDPVHLYMIEAWMGFVPNLLFAEWLIRARVRTLGRARWAVARHPSLANEPKLGDEDQPHHADRGERDDKAHHAPCDAGPIGVLGTDQPMANAPADHKRGPTDEQEAYE